ncbi:MAG: hypothetical protein KGR26_14870, partial [Cyanobacteria bacterium REEB65]|nr:hypothetical protein [Cyanobacteria bacterium REEB65]
MTLSDHDRSGPAFQTVYEGLAAALAAGYRRQIDLVAATEAAYELLEQDDQLTDDQVLGLRVLLAQAETQLG